MISQRLYLGFNVERDGRRRGPRCERENECRKSLGNKSVSKGTELFHPLLLFRIQGGKQDSFQQWEVVPIEVCDVRQVKNSFKKLMKACVPSTLCPYDASMNFLRCLEESEWMALVSDHHDNCLFC